jgi:hypothetical protein
LTYHIEKAQGIEFAVESSNLIDSLDTCGRVDVGDNSFEGINSGTHAVKAERWIISSRHVTRRGRAIERKCYRNGELNIGGFDF